MVRYLLCDLSRGMAYTGLCLYYLYSVEASETVNEVWVETS